MLSSVPVAVKIIVGRRETPSGTEWLSIDKSESLSTNVLSLANILETGVNKNPNFTVIPFYKFKCEITEQERETKEKIFFHKYKPILNAGHEQLHLNSFYVYCFHTEYFCVIRYFYFPVFIPKRWKKQRWLMTS